MVFCYLRSTLVGQANVMSIGVFWNHKSYTVGSLTIPRASIECHPWLHNHAKNEIVGRIIPFLVPSFWDKNTMKCAKLMPFRRNYSGGHYQILTFQAQKNMILPAMYSERAWDEVLPSRPRSLRRASCAELLGLFPDTSHLTGFTVQPVLKPNRVLLQYILHLMQ